VLASVDPAGERHVSRVRSIRHRRRLESSSIGARQGRAARACRRLPGALSLCGATHSCAGRSYSANHGGRRISCSARRKGRLHRSALTANQLSPGAGNGNGLGAPNRAPSDADSAVFLRRRPARLIGARSRPVAPIRTAGGRIPYNESNHADQTRGDILSSEITDRRSSQPREFIGATAATTAAVAAGCSALNRSSGGDAGAACR